MSTNPSDTYKSGNNQDQFSGSQCQKCKDVKEKFRNKGDDFFTLEVKRSVIGSRTRREAQVQEEGEKKEKKKEIKKQKKTFGDALKKRVSALRNTDGGFILIHVVGQKESDRNLQFIDECLIGWLSVLISDGSSYTDNYKRLWLSEFDPSFDNCTDVIILKVNKAKAFVTVDFNSKVRHEHENVHATTSNIVSILLRENSTESTSPKSRFTLDLKQTEDRHFEVKSFSKNADKSLKGICKNEEKLAERIWDNGKLKDNISSMSKIYDGGSYILGVKEEDIVAEEYDSKKLTIEGIHVDVTPEALKRALDDKIQSSVLVLEGGRFENGPGSLIETIVHSTGDSNIGFVLEVAIGFCKGLVFTDTNGPITYQIVRDQTTNTSIITRVTKEDWLNKMREKCFMCDKTND